MTFDKKEAKTYYVNQQDYDAYRRMRQNHFTVGYYSRNSERYLQYPAFAQRRTALGDWVRAENYQIEQNECYRATRISFVHSSKETMFTMRFGSWTNTIFTSCISEQRIGTEAAEALTAHAREKFGLVPNLLEKFTRKTAWRYTVLN